jgi:hypothetical protein
MADGGERLRVRLTNRYGRTPLTIAAATVGTAHGQAALTFDGAEKLTIAPGEEAAADPMDRPGPQPLSPRADRPGHLLPQACAARGRLRRSGGQSPAA